MTHPKIQNASSHNSDFRLDVVSRWRKREEKTAHLNRTDDLLQILNLLFRPDGTLHLASRSVYTLRRQL
jgi:hypothetical protein